MLARAALALSLLVLPLAGCNDTTGPENDIEAAAGTYTLRTVDGSALPVMLSQNATSRVDITAGTLVLRGDGSFTETLQGRETFAATGTTESVQYVENGTFMVTGQVITFSVPQSGDFEGVSWSGGIDDDVVTYTLNDHALSFQRQ